MDRVKEVQMKLFIGDHDHGSPEDVLDRMHIESHSHSRIETGGGSFFVFLNDDTGFWGVFHFQSGTGEVTFIGTYDHQMDALTHVGLLCRDDSQDDVWDSRKEAYDSAMYRIIHDSARDICEHHPELTYGESPWTGKTLDIGTPQSMRSFPDGRICVRELALDSSGPGLLEIYSHDGPGTDCCVVFNCDVDIVIAYGPGKLSECLKWAANHYEEKGG